MIVGIGIDTESVERVERLLRDHDGRLDRIFTQRERKECERASASQRAIAFTAAFAAKEAVMKALGTGWHSEVEWKDIDTPVFASATVRLSGGVARAAKDKGINRIVTSTATTRGLVVATAIAESCGETASLEESRG